MKIPWSKPEMVVLVKRISDEVILATCQVGSGGAGTYNTGCLKRSGATVCITCQ